MKLIIVFVFFIAVYTQCPPSEYFNADSNECVSCAAPMPNCEMCSNAYTCEFCNFGYALSEDQAYCSPCQPNCEMCSSTVACTLCYSGFILEAGECIREEGGQIENCPLGSFFDGSECVACAVMDCEACSGTAATCEMCFPGYVLSTDQAECIWEHSSEDFVTFCPTGSYLAEQQCIPCGAPNCEMCSNTDTCEFCYFGYVLSEDQTQCSPCQPNCEMCSSTAFCESCYSGFILLAGQCILDEGVQIENCPPGSYFDEETCIYCGVPNCEMCSNPETCEFCSYGFALSEDRMQCLPCPANCEICSSTVSCEACYSGYLLQEAQCILEQSTAFFKKKLSK